MFTHLHVHSHYSDGLASPLALAERAQHLGFTHLALTDHNTLDGHAAFLSACALHHLQPVLGVEVRVHTPWGSGHNLVLATNEQEYRYMRWLVQRRKRIMLGDLKPAGIVTSGCLGGVIAQYLQRNDYWSAKDVLVSFQQIFGKQFYVELQPSFGHLLPWYLSLARALNVPVVVTNDVHYLRSDDARRHVNAGLYLTTEDEMLAYSLLEGYHSGIAEAQAIAGRCSWAIAQAA